jgi:hypothetical protein
MQVHTNGESREKQPGGSGAEMGPGRSAQDSRPSTFQARFGAAFDLASLHSIYSPPTKSHVEFIRHLPPRSRDEKDTIPERRGSKWLTRVPLAGVGTLHGRPRRSSRS